MSFSPSSRSAIPVGLVLDPDAVRHTCHVVEVADDLDGVRDGRIVEPLCAEQVDVRLVDLGGEMGQLDREVAERPLARRELRLPVVVLRVSCGLVVCALGTEVVCMRARSVVAVLRGRGDRREQLALLPRQPGLAEHDLAVERH